MRKIGRDRRQCPGATAAIGNQQPAQPAAEAVAVETPAESVGKFLEAVRKGNDEKATAMLSKVAREKLAQSEAKRSVTPPASDTATFEVGKVEYMGEDRAGRLHMD